MTHEDNIFDPRTIEVNLQSLLNSQIDQYRFLKDLLNYQQAHSYSYYTIKPRLKLIAESIRQLKAIRDKLDPLYLEYYNPTCNNIPVMTYGPATITQLTKLRSYLIKTAPSWDNRIHKLEVTTAPKGQNHLGISEWPIKIT